MPNSRRRDRASKIQSDGESADLSMFSARELAHLLAHRILYGMGHYLADDPFGQGDEAGPSDGRAPRR